MAKRNEIKDGVWGNPWFQSLKPNAKLIWLYLLSCPARENSGIFQLSVRTIHSDLENDEVDIPRNEIIDILDKMVEDGHILYQDSYVGLVDQHQHNNYLNNEKFVANIDRQLKTVPAPILQAFVPIIIPTKYHKLLSAIDRLSIGYPPNTIQYNTIYPNTNQTKTKLNQTTDTSSEPSSDSVAPVDVCNDFCLGEPPEPPPDYDAEGKALELQSLTKRIIDFDETRNKALKPLKVPTAEEIHERFATGVYKETDDTEHIKFLRHAEQKATEARTNGIKAAYSAVTAEIDAFDKANPTWWKTWVNISLPKIDTLIKLHPDKDIWRYIKCLARMQHHSPTGKQVGIKYLESCWGEKPWKPEGVE